MSELRTPRFDALLQGYLEGALSAEESLEMNALLTTDPALGDAILEELALSDTLKTLVGEQDRRAADTSASQRRSKISQTTLPAVRRPISKRRRVQRPSWWPAIGLAASLALIAALGVTNGWFSKTEFAPAPSAPAIAMVTAVEGGARVSADTPNTSASTPLAVGVKLHSGERIQTAADGGLSLEYADGTHVDIDADSIAILRDEGGAKRIRLEQGELNASIAKQPTGKPMLFATTQATAVVLGTKLSLAVTPDSARLDVTEGAVRFQKDAANGIEVKQGFSAMAQGSQSIVLTPQHEPLPWTRARFANAVAIERLDERTPKGRPVLKLSYDHHDAPANKKEYCMMSQPLAVSAAARTIRVAYYVVSAAPNARINAILTMKDHGSWYILEQNLTRVTPNAWHEFVVPLDKAQKKQNTLGDATFDKAGIERISVSIWGGKAVLLLGDANISEY